MADTNEVVRHVFVTGLRNAHAVEHQALALMDRQIEHLQNYPEVEARLREHRIETEGQIERLDEILGDLGESHSAIKDAGLSLSGNLAALRAYVRARRDPEEQLRQLRFREFRGGELQVADHRGGGRRFRIGDPAPAQDARRGTGDGAVLRRGAAGGDAQVPEPARGGRNRQPLSGRCGSTI